MVFQALQKGNDALKQLQAQVGPWAGCAVSWAPGYFPCYVRLIGGVAR